MKALILSQSENWKLHPPESFIQGVFYVQGIFYTLTPVIMLLEQNGGNDMFIQIEPTSEIPIYTQLANQLIELIATGTLQASETLPSVRSLAADLGVNMHTVNKAYHELEKKNIIEIIPKSGAVINSISKNGPTETQVNLLKFSI